MSRAKPLYKIISSEGSPLGDLGVPQLVIRFQDRYDRWHHKGSRLLARSYTAALNRYLAARPHIDYHHKNNWARKISYIPYGFRAWAEYMPGGFATYYVYEPHHRRMANGKRLDMITKRLFRHGIEGVGMRTRAYMLSWLVNDWAAGRNEPLRWASIGCGTGQPLYDVARHLPASIKMGSELLLVDQDSIVLNFAQTLYDQQRNELPPALFVCGDIFDVALFENLTQSGPLNVVDMLGIFEYLDHEQSVTLLRRCYNALANGGILIFSNMDTHRPDYDINQRVIGWPELKLRSPQESLRAIVDAEIPIDNVTLVRAPDAINNVFRIEKA